MRADGRVVSGSPVASYPGKTLFDRGLALLLLVLLSPLALAVALAVRLTMGSPVLFRHSRPGLFEKPFTMLKFRTMSDRRGPDGRLRPDGERITRFGAFLRRTSLDELPEILNVIRGDMSFVGPRPLVTEYLPFYTPRERLRFNALPGITGLAQVKGRNFLGWDTRLALDVAYVEGISPWLDFRILLETAWVVLLRKGVSADADQAETWLHEERASRGTAGTLQTGVTGNKE